MNQVEMVLNHAVLVVLGVDLEQVVVLKKVVVIQRQLVFVLPLELLLFHGLVCVTEVCCVVFSARLQSLFVRTAGSVVMLVNQL